MDKRLFTPGPLTTSASVKRAMLRDVGSRDPEFVQMVREVRERLLALAGVSREAGYEAVLMQGSGTFGVESVIGSAVPPGGELLVVINGAYGERIRRIASTLGITVHAVECPETEAPSPDEVAFELARRSGVTHVAVVHCETTTGIMNPVAEIGSVVRRAGRRYVVDSMSAFGAEPVDVAAWGAGFLVSSANKCIEGVPGFSFVVCERAVLLECEGRARSLSLDLVAQWHGLEGNGQFRFTPPTHAILAFRQALEELEAEGGVAGRRARYRANQCELLAGMRELGLPSLLPPDLQGSSIVTFPHPDHPSFDFEELYRRLFERGFVIYPGKLSQRDCFRIGTCGRIEPEDVRALLEALGTTLNEMGVHLSPVES